MNTEQDVGRVGKPTGLSQVEPASGLEPTAFDPSRDVIPLRTRASVPKHEMCVEAWDGLIRVMEANGLARVEITLAQAREIAALVRKGAGCD